MDRHRIVWITGGASGIGRATALLLAGEGAHVVVSDRDESGLGSLAAEADAEIEIEPLDISQSADVTAAAAGSATGTSGSTRSSTAPASTCRIVTWTS